MQTSTFTPADVLQIMGPTGSISEPQNFPSDSMARRSRRRPRDRHQHAPRPRLTIPSYDGTFKIAKVTVELNIAFRTIRRLERDPDRSDGTPVTLFADSLSGANLINTVLDDSAENSITAGIGSLFRDVQGDGHALDA